LEGNICVPTFPPTVCDPETTAPDTDDKGITTCIATGVGGCSVKLACPAPAQGMQTICGQIYDFETNQPFAATGATGTQCAAGATTGPCSLGMAAYDAGTFASSPGSAPVISGQVYIDDCGRYKISDIDLTKVTSHIVAVGVTPASAGAAATTNPVGLTTSAVSTAVKDFDAFVVPPTTIAKWAGSGGPALSAGIFAAIYHANSTGPALATGVTFKSFSGSAQTNTYYFDGTTRSTINTGLTATGASGAVLVTITNGTPTDLYYGTGGLPASCMFEPQPALAISNIILVESFRPVAVSGMTCSL
jgi:hypothetical protein